MADTGTLKTVPAAQTGFTETAFGKLTLKTIPGQCYLLVGRFQQKMADGTISGFSLDKLHYFLLSSKHLAIIFAFFNCDGIGGAYFRTNRVSHIATAITFYSDLICRRRVNDAERANHHTHPTRNACRFVNIYQFCFGVAAHGTIGARIQTGRCHTMPALQGKLFAFHIHPGHRLRLFINGLEQLFGLGCDFRPAP
jgi:hypothetical protein